MSSFSFLTELTRTSRVDSNGCCTPLSSHASVFAHFYSSCQIDLLLSSRACKTLSPTIVYTNQLWWHCMPCSPCSALWKNHVCGSMSFSSFSFLSFLSFFFFLFPFFNYTFDVSSSLKLLSDMRRRAVVTHLHSSVGRYSYFDLRMIYFAHDYFLSASCLLARMAYSFFL